jgi:hypothetical protein
VGGTSLLLVCLLFLSPTEGFGGPAGTVYGGDGQSALPNTWSARSSTGRTLAGTWNAVVDPATGSVTGSWTLDDAKGRPIARGAWSAAKSPTRWTGAWRAAVAGSKTEYSGTWSADVDLKPNAHLADLFKAAVKTAVNGNWRAGGHSGVWAIRVAE